KPPRGSLKYNFGSSWTSNLQHSGTAWVLRNHNGDTLLHSRRSYSRSVSPILSDILSLHWDVERMVNLKQTRIIFEFSSPPLRDVLAHPDYHLELYQHFETLHTLLQRLDSWCLRLAPLPALKAALEIAISVIKDSRFHSYVARNKPSWLRPG
ncbi:unnamed protein product, partial [Brassica rapa subsp. narinosa]